MKIEKITNIINQMIIYLNNQIPHLTYGIPSENFE